MYVCNSSQLYNALEHSLCEISRTFLMYQPPLPSLIFLACVLFIILMSRKRKNETRDFRLLLKCCHQINLYFEVIFLHYFEVVVDL